MKVLIINFNRITLPSNLANFVAKCGLEPIFIDNNSDYPPLLEFYKKSPYRVMRLNRNYGHRVIKNANILDKLGIKGNYIVTDPDLDLSGIPDDFLSVLEEGLKRYPKFDKCGFSLEINDVTNTKLNFQGNSISEWESQFWKIPLDAQYFNAPVDTTFALCKTKHFTYKGIRTNRPYTARHVPWYYNNIEDLPEDEKYYFKTANRSCNWKLKNE